MTATQATIRLYAGSAITVEPFLRLTGNTHILCCTYDDQAPILSIDDEHVRVSVTVPDTRHVTGQDVQRGRLLAEAVAHYVAGLEQRAAIGKDAAGTASGVTEEVAGLCARLWSRCWRRWRWRSRSPRPAGRWC